MAGRACNRGRGPVIVKPASANPLCGFDLVALAHEAGLPQTKNLNLKFKL